MLQIFVTISIIVGMLITFDISPVKLISNGIVASSQKKKSFKKLIQESRGEAKYNIVSRQFAETREILAATERADAYERYCCLSAIFAIIGAAVGFVLSNPLLIPVLAVIGIIIPQLFVKFTATGYKKGLANEIETSLSIVTSSYLLTRDIKTAVSQNLNTLNEPVKSVFERFIFQVTYVHPSVEKALHSIHNAIDNEVWREWIDAVIQCQRDFTLSDMLQPVVGKLTDMSNIQAELDTEIFKPVKTSAMLIIIAIGCIPLTFVLNTVWFDNLFNTFAGKAALAFMSFSILVMLFKMAHATRPIEYRRVKA